MPVEFALRPRIQLREASPRPQRSRVRLPRFALPVALYWLAAGGITYAFVHEHETHPPPADIERGDEPLVAEPTVREQRPWWRLAPTAPPATTEPTRSSEGPSPAAAVAPEPATEPDRLAPAAEAAPALPEPAPVPVFERPTLREPPASPAAPPSTPREARLPAPAEPPAIQDVPEAPAPAPAPIPSPREARSSGLPSCEAAIESAHQDIDFSQGNGTADLPTTAIAAVLENGAWLSSCAVPASTSLDVCVAIRGGSVIGASVSSRPANAEVTACVKRRASALQFPYSSHVDIARTRF
jgi:hypothetical protein